MSGPRRLFGVRFASNLSTDQKTGGDKPKPAAGKEPVTPPSSPASPRFSFATNNEQTKNEEEIQRYVSHTFN